MRISFSEIKNGWQALAFIFTYGKFGLFGFVTLIIVGTILIVNFNYSKASGPSLTPKTTIEIKKDFNKKTP